NAIQQSGPAYRDTLVLLGAAATLGMAFMRRRCRVIAWHAAAALLLSAVLLVLFAGRSRWAALNASMPRYIYMAIFPLQTALLAMAGGTLASRLGKRARLLGRCAAAAGMLAAIAIIYGRPSTSVVRACLDERLGGASDAILQAGCTHVAGAYW